MFADIVSIVVRDKEGEGVFSCVLAQEVGVFQHDINANGCRFSIRTALVEHTIISMTEEIDGEYHENVLSLAVPEQKKQNKPEIATPSKPPD